MKDKTKVFVAIAGNIGAGKTTLTKKLSQQLGWKAYFEKVINNPYLNDFYGDMNRWSFHLQIYFLSQRFKSQKEIFEWPGSCVLDRSIYEDVEIFAYTLHEQGYMTDRDYGNYRELFYTMVPYLRKPDLILYLRSPIDRLLKHIQSRGRDYEKSIDVKYLTRLNQAYDNWIDRAIEDGFNINIIETRGKDFENNEDDFMLICNAVKDLEKQTWLKGV